MSLPAASTPSADDRRNAARQMLPTCQRCRRLRRKCDTELPSCRPCVKAGAECTFHDHALQHALPRSYIDSLLKRVEDLQTAQQSYQQSPITESRSLVTQAVPEPETNALEESLPPSSHPVPPSAPSFDVVIPSTSTSGKSRYWGSSSAFVLNIELLQHAAIKGLVSIPCEEDDTLPMIEGQGDYQSTLSLAGAFYYTPDATITYLVQSYLKSIDTLYGFVDHDETSAELEAYLSLRRQPDFSPQLLRGDQAHCFFRITMMCAIACACQARYQPQQTAQCFAFYRDASQCVEEVTSEATSDTLRALLHLIVFCLFQPRQGDIWKLLDYACRLTIELGYHTETAQDPQMDWQSPADTHNTPAPPTRAKLRRSTFWGLYAIERIVGQLFGRASDLPESIITTEYPYPVRVHAGGTLLDTASNNGRCPSTTSIDQVTFQSMSISHHYRLVYLRSEIFREMYLPAKPPDLGLSWLREKHATLYAWRQELAVSDDLEGVATLTCDVGFDATICFLFQPLLLKALRWTSESETSDSEDGITVASDPFLSAINLIRIYDKIIRAPEHSSRGAYPMTFMSAHYIYLATSTLLAYGLIGLDGRVRVLWPMSEMDAAQQDETHNLDWNEFIDVAGTCLVLMAWCSERWPGFGGTLHIYKRLFARVTKELIGTGGRG
ncbi:hypothetical protein PFICI_00936 [Pestalotiopsis fici W106-1]|uniref:Zn(2)-C6 fungal-type domain-containing protein n=1 Tax=Pestalotiopsis fici (strain W106-1 / CGMCC3.15140) TaxID=1229662 RepID=W3XM24_PESFW|nr:uncharacterized protein PFICI_00936 [Pestalotiopsis fici W106-1]ETS87108.1 hypothetical protein PFICI_00936 [Pestalotiopsis fici W106-1]